MVVSIPSAKDYLKIFELYGDEDFQYILNEEFRKRENK